MQSQKSKNDFQTTNLQLINQLSYLEDALTTAMRSKKEMAPKLLRFAQLNYNNGEIDFFDYLQVLEQVKEIEQNFLNVVLEYNHTQINLHYQQ